MLLSMFLVSASDIYLVSIFSTVATASGTFITFMGNGTAPTFATTSWANIQPAIPPFPPRNSVFVPCPAPPSSSRNATVHNPVHVSSAYPSTLATSCYAIPGGTHSSTPSHKPGSFIYTTTSSTVRSPASPHWATWNTLATLGAGTASTASPSANTATSQDASDYATKQPVDKPRAGSTESPRSTKTITLIDPVTPVTATTYPSTPTRNPGRRSAAAPPPDTTPAAQSESGEPSVTVTVAFVPTTTVTIASTGTVAVCTTITAMGVT